MEANRNYIIILSVSLVLAGFFGAAAWLFYPYQTSTTLSDPAQISRFFQEPSNTPTGQNDNIQIQPPITVETPVQPTRDLEIVYGILDDANFIDDPLGRRLNGISDSGAETSVMTDNRLSVQVETRTPARELGAGSTPMPSTTSPSGTGQTSTTPVPSGTSAQATSRTTQTTQTATAPLNQQRTIEEFWIQVVSSPNRDRVLQAQEELESLGIGGRITTVVVENTTFYRLRYGPYTQRAEAQKFLDWLKDIPRYEESFISIEYRTRNE